MKNQKVSKFLSVGLDSIVVSIRVCHTGDFFFTKII